MWTALLMSTGITEVGSSPLDLLRGLTVANVLLACLIVALVAVSNRIATRLLEAFGERAPRARFFFKMLGPLLRFALWIAATFAILALFAPTRQTLFAVIASLGIAVALGAQDLVKNLIGGLVILVDRPYQLGDRVKIGDAYGEIDHIGLRSTKLTTADDTRVTIPNSDILSGMAWNANSGVPDCQVVTDLYLPHGADAAAAIEIGREAAYCSPYTLLAKPVVALAQEGYQNGPFLRLRVKAYVVDHRFEPLFQSDITVRAKREFRRRGTSEGWAPVGPDRETPAD